MSVSNVASPLARRRRRAALLFLTPACLMFTAYVIYPILRSIMLSFYNWDGVSPATFAGFANYLELFH
jgi:multiple sugar transport system permease protein